MMNVYMADFIVGMVLAILTVCIIYGVICYIFESIGLFTIAKRRGIRAYGLAWVPVGNSWLFGYVADRFDDAVKGKNMKLKVLLPIGQGLGIAFLVIYLNWYISFLVNLQFYTNYEAIQALSTLFGFLVFGLVLVVFAVFTYIAMWKIYCSCSRQTATVFLVLSILFGLAPFFIFADRNKDEAIAETRTEADYIQN